MANGGTQLEDYVERVLSDEDRLLVREAVDAYAAGAKRGAYILLWLSAAESIKRKFRELAGRDHVAAGIVRDIEQKEAAHRSVDALLIDKAKDYGFVTDAEATRLKHVYENRNVYGHPYEEAPSDEAIVAGAAEVLATVLERPTRLRHGYLQEQVGRLTDDPTFLDDLRQPVEEYAVQLHERAAEDLHVWFLERLWTALDPVVADPARDLLARRGVWFSQSFLRQGLPGSISELDPVNVVPQHPELLAHIFADPELFERLGQHEDGDHAQDIVVGVLLAQGATKRKYLALLHELGQDRKLSDRHGERFSDALGGMDMNRLLSSGLPTAAYAERIRDGLRTKSWYDQNPAAMALERGGPNGLTGVGPDLLSDIGRNLLSASDGNAWDAQGALAKVAGGTPQPWPDALVAGVVHECFANERGELRVKASHVRPALAGLSTLSADAASALLDEVEAAVRSGHPRMPWGFEQEREEAVSALEEATAAHDAFPPVAGLVEALRAVVVDEPEEPDGYIVS